MNQALRSVATERVIETLFKPPLRWVLSHAVRYQLPSLDPVLASCEPLVISQPSPATHEQIVATLYRMSAGAAVDCERGYVLNDGSFISVTEFATAERIIR